MTWINSGSRWITRCLAAAAVIGVLAGCKDGAGLNVGEPVSFAKGGRWAGDGSTTADTQGGDTGSDTAGTFVGTIPPGTLRQVAGAPPVQNYHPSFWAKVGFRTTFLVRYARDPVTGWTIPFLSVTIPRDAEFVDEAGDPLQAGDSVLVSLDIDPEYFHVEFGPHGAMFGGKKPAIIEFTLDYADLGGADPSALSVFYRPQPGDPLWSSLPTEFTQLGWRVQAPLYHFSGYAVAW